MSTVSNRAPRAVVASVAALVALCGASAASAAVISWSAHLDGPSESPPNSSPGTGSALVDYDNLTHLMRVRVTFTGLVGNTTASHIHSATAVAGVGTAGVATQTPSFTGFPLGVTAGSMDTTFDMSLASSYNPAFVTAKGSVALAEAALIQSFDDGKAYLNIHTSFVGSGEIRGFLARVPAPSSLAMLGLAGVVAGRRRRA